MNNFLGIDNNPNPIIKDDEIDLKIIFNRILRKKFIVIYITSLTTLASIIYGFIKTPI